MYKDLLNSRFIRKNHLNKSFLEITLKSNDFVKDFGDIFYDKDFSTRRIIKLFLLGLLVISFSFSSSLYYKIFIDKIASENQISKEAIYAEVNKLSYNKDSVEKILKKPIVKKEEIETINPAIIKRENMILYLLINDFEKMSIRFSHKRTCWTFISPFF